MCVQLGVQGEVARDGRTKASKVDVVKGVVVADENARDTADVLAHDVGFLETSSETNSAFFAKQLLSGYRASLVCTVKAELSAKSISLITVFFCTLAFNLMCRVEEVLVWQYQLLSSD